MTRNMDLIRELMLKLEGFSSAYSIFHIKGDDEEIQIDGFDCDQIDYHLSLIDKAGFIEPCGSKPMIGILFRQLSWAGHDFIDSVRDPVIWAKTKRSAEAAGGFTVDLLKELAKGFLKKQVEDYTGIKI